MIRYILYKALTDQVPWYALYETHTEELYTSRLK